MYVTGEKDPICLFGDTQSSQERMCIIDMLCKWNPHLKPHKPLMFNERCLPPFTPIVEPNIHPPLRLNAEVNDVKKATQASTEERQKMRFIFPDPESILMANQTLIGRNKTKFEQFNESYIQPQPFAITYSVLSSLATEGRKAIETSYIYEGARKFHGVLDELDALMADHNTLVKKYGSNSHPEVKAAWKKFIDKNTEMRRAHGRELSQLPHSVKRQIKSHTLSSKGVKRGPMSTQHNTGKLIGSKYLSYDTMNRLIKGTHYVNKAVLGLGAIGAGTEMVQAYQKGDDWLKPGVKWGGNLAGSFATGYVTTQVATAAIPLAVTAVTGLATEAVVVFLTCTPWGWVTLGIIVGVASFFGGSYGEKLFTSVYDKAKPYVVHGWEKTKEYTHKAIDAGHKVITESWEGICDYAKGLHDYWFPHAQPAMG